MKAILEFNLNEQEDVAAHKRATKALDMALVLWDIDHYLRTQVKYNEALTQEAHDAFDNMREKFYEILNGHNINIDEILQ
jgi:hypothetical protein